MNTRYEEALTRLARKYDTLQLGQYLVGQAKPSVSLGRRPRPSMGVSGEVVWPTSRAWGLNYLSGAEMLAGAEAFQVEAPVGVAAAVDFTIADESNLRVSYAVGELGKELIRRWLAGTKVLTGAEILRVGQQFLFQQKGDGSED